MLRMELYYNEFGDLGRAAKGMKVPWKKQATPLGCCNAMPHRGFEPTLASIFGYRVSHPRGFTTVLFLPNPERSGARKQNATPKFVPVMRRGSVSELADAFEISEQRVSQIIPASELRGES